MPIGYSSLGLYTMILTILKGYEPLKCLSLVIFDYVKFGTMNSYSLGCLGDSQQGQQTSVHILIFSRNFYDFLFWKLSFENPMVLLSFKLSVQWLLNGPNWSWNEWKRAEKPNLNWVDRFKRFSWAGPDRLVASLWWLNSDAWLGCWIRVAG